MNTKNSKKTLRNDMENKAAIARLMRSTAEMVRNMFAPGGHVRTGFLSEIEALPENEIALRAYAATLGPRIAEAVHAEIRETFARARDAVTTLASRRKTPARTVPPAVARFVSSTSAVAFTDDSLFSRARNVFFGGMFGLTAGQFIAMVCYKCGLRAFSLVIPFVCAAIGIIGGYLDMRRRSCHGHKARLAAHVQNVMNDLQAKYFTPARVGSMSEIERCMAVLNGTAPDALPTGTGYAERPRDAASATLKTQTVDGSQRNHVRVAIGNVLRQARTAVGHLLESLRARLRTDRFCEKSRQVWAIVRS